MFGTKCTSVKKKLEMLNGEPFVLNGICLHVRIGCLCSDSAHLDGFNSNYETYILVAG